MWCGHTTADEVEKVGRMLGQADRSTLCFVANKPPSSARKTMSASGASKGGKKEEEVKGAEVGCMARGFR